VRNLRDLDARSVDHIYTPGVERPRGVSGPADARARSLLQGLKSLSPRNNVVAEATNHKKGRSDRSCGRGAQRAAPLQLHVSNAPQVGGVWTALKQKRRQDAGATERNFLRPNYTILDLLDRLGGGVSKAGGARPRLRENSTLGRVRHKENSPQRAQRSQSAGGVGGVESWSRRARRCRAPTAGGVRARCV